MKVLERSVYVGPSQYAHFPVIRLKLDLGPLEEWSSTRLGDSFVRALVEALPGLQEHGCSYGEPGGFIRRLTEDEGTWMGHVLEHAAIEIQNMAGEDVTFGKTRGAGEKGVYNVVYEYVDRKVGIEAGKLALALLHSLVPQELVLEPDDPEFDFEEARDDFIRYTQKNAFGPSTAALVKAAEERDIPWIRLNDYSLIQFGHGKHRQRIQATITSQTPHIGVEIASDKEETNQLLGRLGLPVPRQRLVYREEDAAVFAERIGFPVVVKPLNANHGRGVSIAVPDSEHVRIAFQQAREHSRGVIVETYVTGLDHRMLVVNGELVAVAKRVPGHVVGDGKSTIEELVDEVNSDPRRGIGHEKVLTKIEFDYQANRLLGILGYEKTTVPPKDEPVYLRSTGNLSTGGTAVDVTDLVHPDNRDMAERAAKAIGLDVAGVDFLTDDISRSFKEIGGGICEVNAAPGFRMHTNPSEGMPRDVAGKVMDMLFPEGSPARIPILSLTGTNGKTTTVRMLAHIYKMAGASVGLTTTDGVYIDGQMTVEGDMTGPTSARMVLQDPSVDVAVLETARGGLLRSGMGYRRCDVGACLNVAADHLGLKGIDTLEDLAEVKRIVIEIAKNTAVLNADDELCIRMADYTDAEHVCYVTMNPSHSLVREHIRAGGRAVGIEEGVNGHMITIYDGGSHIPLLWTHLIPATLGGKALHNVQNAMFAAAMAFSAGVKLEDIKQGLKTFDTTFFQAPGRLNFYDEHPFKVLLDYAHNANAVEVIVKLVGNLEVHGNRICVLAAPGDRRDKDVEDIARAAAGAFDHYILRRDDALRGRGHDEIPQLLAKILEENGVPENTIEIVAEEPRAVARGLERAESDDLLVIFADQLKRTWDQIVGHNANEESAPEESASTLPHDSGPPVDSNGESPILIRDERGVRFAREVED